MDDGSDEPPMGEVAFKTDENISFFVGENIIEGIYGAHDNQSIDLQTPSGDKQLPE